MADRKRNAETVRLAECGRRADKGGAGNVPWKKWGPYLSERQWGTVREDYSENGDAWNYLSHDHARSRTYRWGEDGLGGSATTARCSVSPWPSGTEKIRSSRSGCSA